MALNPLMDTKPVKPVPPGPVLENTSKIPKLSDCKRRIRKHSFSDSGVLSESSTPSKSGKKIPKVRANPKKRSLQQIFFPVNSLLRRVVIITF